MISGDTDRAPRELRGDITGDVSSYDDIIEKDCFVQIRDSGNRFPGEGRGMADDRVGGKIVWEVPENDESCNQTSVSVEIRVRAQLLHFSAATMPI